MPVLTFVIPVRHQANAPDWARLKANLGQTVASIAAQANNDWQAVIVANHGADLPSLPGGFIVERVDFPPNSLHERGSSSETDFYNAFRFDKGRRVLRGMLATRDSRYFMIVDDDDFVSAQLTGHVARHNGENGWKIDKGYVWNDGGSLLYAHGSFNKVCGTSLIVRSDLYALPRSFEDADPHYMMSMLGSHHSVAETLAGLGHPLLPLPFRGAVYRVANAGSHSQTPGILRKYVFKNGKFWRHPKDFLTCVAHLRLVNGEIRREFFGGGSPAL